MADIVIETDDGKKMVMHRGPNNPTKVIPSEVKIGTMKLTWGKGEENGAAEAN